jgi:hypothetical protein
VRRGTPLCPLTTTDLGLVSAAADVEIRRMPLREPGARVAVAGLPPQRLPRSVSAAASVPSASIRKPPEPLRRAVADCLSPPAPHTHGPPAAAASAAAEASRTLRVTFSDSIFLPSPFLYLYHFSTQWSLFPACQDYIANPSTMEMAYNVLIDHALAESDRRSVIHFLSLHVRTRAF